MIRHITVTFWCCIYILAAPGLLRFLYIGWECLYVWPFSLSLYKAIWINYLELNELIRRVRTDQFSKHKGKGEELDEGNNRSWPRLLHQPTMNKKDKYKRERSLAGFMFSSPPFSPSNHSKFLFSLSFSQLNNLALPQVTIHLFEDCIPNVPKHLEPSAELLENDSDNFCMYRERLATWTYGSPPAVSPVRIRYVA